MLFYHLFNFTQKKNVENQAYSEPLIKQIAEKQIRWVNGNKLRIMFIFLNTIYTVGTNLNGLGQIILRNMCKICFIRALKKVIL